MHKFWQSEWQGIEFRVLTKLNPFKIADSNFYNLFYKKFFELYNSWEDLNPESLTIRKKVADFILNHVREFGSISTTKILSLGCGTGFIENQLFTSGLMNIDITEVGEVQLKWIKNIIPEDKVFIGLFPECIPEKRRYDLIYFVSLDYIFNKKEFIDFLKIVKRYLLQNGRCLVISTSFEKDEKFNYKLLPFIKRLIKNYLAFFHLADSDQLWGYMRTKQDYWRSISESGFADICDGFITEQIYFISGKI